MEELADALMCAVEKDAAVVQLVDKADPVVAAEPGCEADSAASVRPVDEPIFAAAAKSEPGTGSVAAAGLVNEPRSFAVKPVGEGWCEAAVKSLGVSCFAVAVAAAPVGEPCSAYGPPGWQAEPGLVGGGEQVGGDLKCFEWHTAHC